MPISSGSPRSLFEEHDVTSVRETRTLFCYDGVMEGPRREQQEHRQSRQEPPRVRFADGFRGAQKRDRAANRDPQTAERRWPVFQPSIDMTTIFRDLIADEVRTGRLSRARRRRIVQYAAHLGLSAVQVGRLIAECQEESTRSDDHVGGLSIEDWRLKTEATIHNPQSPVHRPPSVPMPLKIAVVVAAAMLLGVLLVKWLS